MKRHLILMACGVTGLSGIMFLYRNGQGRLEARQQEMLSLISLTKQIDTAVNAEVLKSRDFLSLNYDSIVQVESKLQQVCNSFHEEVKGLAAADLNQRVNKLCGSIKSKLASVEAFKSRSSILRNSLFFLQGLGAASRAGDGGLARRDAELVAAGLSYYFMPNSRDQSFLDRFLASPAGRSDSALIASHVRKVLQGKDEIDGLVGNILRSETGADTEALLNTFLRAYDDSSRTARAYRQMLFWLAVFLLAFAVYCIGSVIRYARQLAESNEHLEARVDSRTMELKDAQALVTQQQQSLMASTKLSSLGEMAGGIAHEINNPLAVIKTVSSQLTDVLGEQPVDAGLAASMAESITKTADRIARIVQGLRTFSRDGSNDPFVPVEVGTLVGDTLAFCLERYKTHGVKLEVAEISPGLSFEGRGTQISQVLLNLCNNAFDAISRLPEKWVKVSARQNGEMIEIRVTDSGPGIPEAVRKKLFQPFFTTKEIGKGTGLGLSISHGILQAHKGTIYVDAESDHTCFVVCIPRHRAAEASATGEAA